MWWSAFFLGLVSSLHCIGMCGPLQAAAMGTFHKSASAGFVALYHFSRIFTYGMLGLMAGFIGKGVGLQNWQQQTSLVSGLLLLFAFAAFYLLRLDKKLLQVLFPFISRLRGKLQQNKSARAMYFSGSGLINGLLPCGMVYLAIFPAMSSGSVITAFGYMVLFGLGTLPILILSNFGALSFLQSRGRAIQRIIPAMIVITALLLILRGMDLGIPYISPQAPISGASVEVCD